MYVGYWCWECVFCVSVYASQFRLQNNGWPCIGCEMWNVKCEKRANISFIGFWDLLVKGDCYLNVFNFHFLFDCYFFAPASIDGWQERNEITTMKGYLVRFDGTTLYIPIRKHLLSILLLKRKKKRKKITAIWDFK